MIAVDTNILVYAHRRDSPWHEQAERCIKQLAEGRIPCAIPWPCVHEFIAIVTHPRMYDPPTPPQKAIDQLEGWFRSPTVVLLSEGGSYWQALRMTLHRSRVTGPKVHDARVAAVCQVHGIRELRTADRDFGRFPAVKTRNPLAE